MSEEKTIRAVPARYRLSDERPAITHKFSVGGCEGYLRVGLYSDGEPGEMFITIGKAGSTLSGIMDQFAIAISMLLQYGVPLKVLAKKFRHTRFEPNGFTSHEQIEEATSIIDYIFHWLGFKFLNKEDMQEIEAEKHLLANPVSLDRSGG